ncbi:hypothetical protein EYF80_034761 [Liparis tanakae]|uniref:Uncharacterized protein n=1 Tax=Liparis tanakae TaxID=230148 RepID=A0A4Z2GPN1_9TELE|nr:hypothetical protein EYF80_034761 [Liparis tanakae]
MADLPEPMELLSDATSQLRGGCRRMKDSGTDVPHSEGSVGETARLGFKARSSHRETVAAK